MSVIRRLLTVLAVAVGTCTPAPPAADPAVVTTTTTTTLRPTVVVLGDSLAYAATDHIVTQLTEFAVTVDAQPGEGFGGNADSDVRTMTVAAAFHAIPPPDVVVLALGTNDAYWPAITMDETRAGFDEIVALYPASCVVTIGVRYGSTAHDDEARRINRWARNVADVHMPGVFPVGDQDPVHARWYDGVVTYGNLVVDGVRRCA